MPPDPQTAKGSTYVYASADTPEEIVRVTEESWLFTQTLGGPLTGIHNHAAFNTILDLSCGPGDWALDVAFRFPDMEVVGIDFNAKVISYAVAKARAQGIENVSFEAMNWLQNFEFLDNSFDFINGRLLVGVMPKSVWPRMLQESMRVLRPGGILRSIECDTLIANSYAFEMLHYLGMCAMQRSGYGFSPTGRTLGMSPVLPTLFRTSGFQEVTYVPHSIDFSSGSDAWACLYHNIETAYKSLIPLMVAMGVTNKKDAEAIYEQALTDMMDSEFRGSWPFFSVSGCKPDA